MGMSPDHQAWQRPSYKALEEGEDKGSGGKTRSEHGQVWTFQSQRAVDDGQTWKAAGCEIIGGAPTTLRVKGTNRDR